MPQDALDRGVDGLEAIVEAQPSRTQRRPAIIREGTAHSEAVGARGLRGRIGARFELPFERPDFPDVLLEFLLGMAIGFVNWLRRFAEVVEVAQLVRHAWQRGLDCPANRVLPVGNDAPDRHGQRLLDLLEQGGEILLRRAQETPGEQDLPGQTVAQDPHDLVAYVGLQAVEGQQHAPLRQQAVLQPALIGQAQGEQLFIALHEVGDRALGNVEPPLAQRVVDFGHGLMSRIALRADPRDHRKPERAVGERPAALLFRPIGLVIQGTGGRLAAANLARQVHEPFQSDHRARIGVGDPEPSTTALTVGAARLQDVLNYRVVAALAFGHAAPPGPEIAASLAAPPAHSPAKFATIEKKIRPS